MTVLRLIIAATLILTACDLKAQQMADRDDPEHAEVAWWAVNLIEIGMVAIALAVAP